MIGTIKHISFDIETVKGGTCKECCFYSKNNYCVAHYFSLISGQVFDCCGVRDDDGNLVRNAIYKLKNKENELADKK